MLFDWSAIATYAVLIAFGSTVRTILGIYKAYNTYPDFQIEWKRISVEVVASVFFGAFGFYFLQGLGIFNFGLNLAAPIAGLFGADAVKLITRRFGLTKGLEVTISTQQMKYADLNDREVRALEYVNKYGKINNSVYQKINFVGPDTAKRELSVLVRKGKLVRDGSTKGATYNFPVAKESGAFQAKIGTPKTIPRIMHQKTPNRKLPVANARLEAQKRDLQESRLRR